MFVGTKKGGLFFSLGIRPGRTSGDSEDLFPLTFGKYINLIVIRRDVSWRDSTLKKYH